MSLKKLQIEECCNFIERQKNIENISNSTCMFAFSGQILAWNISWLVR